MVTVALLSMPLWLDPAALATGQTADQRVIVVLRNQDSAQPATRSLLAQRRALFGQAQAPVLAQLSRTHARSVRSYSVIDAISAIVTPSEVSALKSDPAVGRVVPDEVIRLGGPAEPPAIHAATSAPSAPLPGACAPNGGVKLEPEGLEAIHADSDVAGAQTAHSLGITGAGVKVGYIADAVNIRNPDFIRANGRPVFFDYKDFTGTGTAQPADAQESFLDSSAIAAQGLVTYDISHYSALPLDRACKIRIEGVAPGASLAGLISATPTSNWSSTILQAIDYAVTTDHVDVLNESLGANPLPDDAAPLDLIKQANAGAVAAGTTVVVATGDAGPTNTTGSPATDPTVIAVGGSTTYRIAAQTGEDGTRLPGVTGWLNDNISPLSSSGFDQEGRTIDLVAPGDSNWALCTPDTTKYAHCKNDVGAASATMSGGGTSQSAPMVSGVAALVIQAYREKHAGATPTPALVKQLIVSNTDDLGAPAEQQGSGLVDAYKAVLAAEDYQVSSTGSKAALLGVAPTQLNAVDAQGSRESFTEKLTNNGNAPAQVSLTTRTLGGYNTVKTKTVTLADSNPQFVTANGLTNNLQTVKFTVPASENRLSASIAYDDAQRMPHPARITLVDPNGKLASYSLPQGSGSYGNSQVTDPVAGTWTAYVYSPDSADAGFTGSVIFGAQVAKYKGFGHVMPSSVTLGVGQSTTVTVTETTPAAPGDASGAVLVDATPVGGGTSTSTTIPITLRSLIPAGSASFAGTLTGGNGRQVNSGQEAFYELNLPAGAPALNATITLNGDSNNPFGAYLVDPEGQALAYAVNTVYDGSGNPINLGGAQLHVVSPAAGTWRLLIAFRPQVSGTALSEPFTITTDQTPASVSTGGLPHSPATTLAAGTAHTYSLRVSNAGPGDAFYFVDPRLPGTTKLQLNPFGEVDSVTEPLTGTEDRPTYEIPTHTTSLTFGASTGGPNPIQFDATGPGFSNPDIASPSGTNVAASLTTSQVEPGPWSVYPVDSGVFGPQGESSEQVHTRAHVSTSPFDPTITSSTGDLEADSLDPFHDLGSFAPIDVAPGSSGTIAVTIKPTGSPGTRVTGTVYIDDYSDSLDVLFSNPIGQEVAAVPYSYTIASGAAATRPPRAPRKRR